MRPAVRYWAVIPAAGSGSRMGSTRPKQYLPLLGRSLLEWSAEPFLAAPWIEGVVLVLAAGDRRFRRLALARHPKLRLAEGGARRADSVLAGLRAIPAGKARQTFVLVHDAARPCVKQASIESLRDAAGDRHGGLLAIPQSDTLKLARGTRSVRTVDRAGLWRAQTPQMFRLDLLERALQGCLARGIEVTDEAAAIETAGLRPRLVPGDGRNVKVTYPEDLRLAEFWLSKT